MADLLDSLDERSVRRNLADCIARENLDISRLENRFLLFSLNGPQQTLYQNHAADGSTLLREAVERAPHSGQSGAIYDNRPPFEYGAIFDAEKGDLLVYRLRFL